MLSTRGRETEKTLSDPQGAPYDRRRMNGCGESSVIGTCTRQDPPGQRGCSPPTSRAVREGKGGTHCMQREQLEQRKGERQRPLGELDCVLRY